jgi:hypothetical protein
MPVQFDCSCGQSLTVPDHLAGQRVRCPRCDRALVAAVTETAPYLPTEVAANETVPIVPPRGSNTALWVGVTVGVLLLGGALLTVFLLNRKDRDDPDRSGGPSGNAVRDAANRTALRHNMMQVLIALQNYHDQFAALPPAVIEEPGKPPRSWRVDLLPYLEELQVYNLWNKDLPYDHPTNRALWDRMPKVYDLPGQPGGRQTHLQRFVEAGKPAQRLTLTMITTTNGTSNCVALGLAARPVLWCAPEDMLYTPAPQGFPPSNLLMLGSARNLTLLGTYDGAVRSVKATVDPKALQIAITPLTAEVLPPIWDD